MTTALAPRLFDPDQALTDLLTEPVVRGIDDGSVLEAKHGMKPVEDTIAFTYGIDYFLPWA